MKVSTVFACVRNIAEDIGKLPLFLYRRLSPGGKERVAEHPLYRLLRYAPNDEMSSMDFRQTMTADLLLGGNGYAEIVRSMGGTVVGLNHIARDRVTVKRRDSGDLFYEVRQNSGGAVSIDARNMLHIRGLGDGLVGWSIVKLARHSIGSALASDKYGEAFASNNARPGGVLEHPGKLKPESLKQLRESWEKTHGGPENANKVAILEEGMKFHAMSISNEDAQFIEGKEFSVEDICRWFRCPPHKVGHLKRATGWSTLEATNTDYVTDTLMPHLTRWENEIWIKLLTPAEQRDLFAEHLVNGLMRGDSAARSAYYREQWSIGAMSQNDIRSMENMNGIGPVGDVLYVPTNMVPSEIAAKGPKTPEAKEPAPAKPSGDDPKEPAEDGADSSDESGARTHQFLIDTHVLALERCFRARLEYERERVTEASKRPGLSAWGSRFYGDAEDGGRHVLDLTCDALGACAASFFAVFGQKSPENGHKEAVFRQTKAAALRHVERSRNEMTDPAKVDRWPIERAKEQAEAEVRAMAELVRQLTTETK